MERGYLFLLIGALLMATTLLPFNVNVLPFFSLDFFGYVFILSGIREMRTSAKELRNSYYFAVTAMILRFLLPMLLGLIISALPFNFLGILPVLSVVLSVFFTIGIFFWLFKAEYMWSPHNTKRFDWLMYSIVSLVYLLIYGMFMFPIGLRLLPDVIFVHSIEIFRFINFLYYAVLIYILAKLYLNARGNTPGFKRWG